LSGCERKWESFLGETLLIQIIEPLKKQFQIFGSETRPETMGKLISTFKTTSFYVRRDSLRNEILSLFCELFCEKEEEAKKKVGKCRKIKKQIKETI
jgi:hypothetical protein